jgi:hypothetical protein
MLAQEELWVYEALLKVIRNTNDNSKGKENDKTPLTHKTARIKEILALEIGNEAVLSWTGREGESAVIILPAEGAAADAHAPPAKAPPPAAMTSRPTASYLDKSGATGSPLVGRYVDNNGKPLEDPSQQPNQEFRMMPIDLRLIIEQKAIPRLLAECANSSMRIDVRSVRILAEKPPAFDITSSNNPAPAGMPGGMGRGFGGRDMFSGGMSAPARAGRTDSGDANSEEESADSVYPPVLVEIQGIIYIYNQPTTGNQGEGGVNAAAAATPAGTASPAAPVNPQPGVTPGKAPAGTGAPAPVVPGTNPLPAARGPGAPGTAAPPVPPTRGVRP